MWVWSVSHFKYNYCQKPILYTLMKPGGGGVHGWNEHNSKNHKWYRFNCVTYGCLGIYQRLTVQRYHIYRFDRVYPTYVHYEKSKGNVLIQMQLILACKVHIVVYFFVLGSFSIHAGDCWVLKGVNGKWRVVTFMKSYVTLMKSCDFYERWWPFQKIVTFPKICDLSDKAQ